MTYVRAFLVSVCFSFFGCFEADFRTEELDESLASTDSALTCEPLSSDTCCEGTRESCIDHETGQGFVYGKTVADYLGFDSKSNGECTGRESGAYQCAQFAKNFFSDRLQHTGDAGFTKTWSPLVDGKYTNAALSVEESNQNKKDPLFVFRSIRTGWNGLTEAPRETDILVFESGGAGHFVVAMEPDYPSETSLHLPIIEENVAKTSGNGPGGSCHHRVLVGTKDSSDKWMIESGIGSSYKYTGFIRHNLAGIYADNGWHDDGKSKAFRDAYLAVANGDTGKILGWAFSDNKGSPFVHEVHGVTLQNFENNDTSNRFGTDGQTALALSKDSKKAYLLKEGFWGAYKCIPRSDGKAMGGAEYLGAPKSDEVKGKIDGNCHVLPASDPASEVTYQLFEGGCLWWKGTAQDQKVHVHTYDGTLIDEDMATSCGVQVENNPPSADCVDDCDPGEQECSGTRNLKICGYPGTDSCYHWLTMNCSSDTVCEDDACVSSTGTPVTTATASGAGGATTSSSDDEDEAETINDTECTWHERRCVSSNRNIYQLCLLDTYVNETYWETIGCSTGLECTGTTGVCSTSIVVSAGGTSSANDDDASIGGTSPIVNENGGASVISNGGTSVSSAGSPSIDQENEGGPVSIQDVSQGGASSLGGSASQGGESSIDDTEEQGGSSSISSSGASSMEEGGSESISSGGASMQSAGGTSSVSNGGTTSSSDSTPIGGAGFVNPETEIEDTHIHFRYEGVTVGENVLEGWWYGLVAPEDTWQNAFLEDCPDDDPTDAVLECDLPFSSGYIGFLFQVHLPDGRYWGDMSEDVTGGHGETIGAVTLTKNGIELLYSMIAKPEGSMYFMGSLATVPE
jgi:hypothetical protein